MLALVHSYSQSQARLMFATTLGMDNFGCTKMMQILLAPPLPLSYLAKQLTALFHTQTLFSFLLYCVVVPTIYCAFYSYSPAQHSKHWVTVTYTRLGIRSQDLGLPDEYSLAHRGFSAASRRKLAFTSKHYTLLTATDTTCILQNSFFFFFFF